MKALSYEGLQEYNSLILEKIANSVDFRGSVSSILNTNLNSNKVLITDKDGKISVATNITPSLLNQLIGLKEGEGITIQTQIDGKLAPNDLRITTTGSGNVVTNVTYDEDLKEFTLSKENIELYTLPKASSETLGGVKIEGAPIASTDGYTPVVIDEDGKIYHKNDVYNLNSFGINVTAAELNCLDNIEGNVQTLLNQKVNQESGKGLSTNDFNNTYLNMLENLDTSLAAKVDKEDGRGLSDKNFTATDKANLDAATQKLKDIEDGANNYSLPIAGIEVLGGVKTTSTILDVTNYTACPIVDGVPYYENFRLTDLGITATADELNYCTGTTSNIQEQINLLDDKIINITISTVDLVPGESQLAEGEVYFVYE